MTDRAYTVAEIDALRDACQNKWTWGVYSLSDLPMKGGMCGRGWRGSERDVAVEAMVRTHMLAGHTAADLKKSVKP